MFNFDHIIPLAAEASGDRPLLAAPYSLPPSLCRELVSQGLISGYIADSRASVIDTDDSVAGWWIDRKRGTWFLRSGRSRSIIFLSAQNEDVVSGRMLLEARLKGCRRILLAGPNGSIVHEVDVAASLLRSLNFSSIDSYENAFAEMYVLVHDALRLGERAFDQDRVLILCGSLRPGGAERQATYTACGLARNRPGKVHVGVSATIESSHFYRHALNAASVPIHVVARDEHNSSPRIEHIRNQLVSRYVSLNFLNIFDIVLQHAALIRAVRPGLVHCFLDYTNVLGGIAADLVGVPRLVLSGRSVAPDHFKTFQPYMAPGYYALLARRPLVFLNNSSAGADDYARWLGVPRDQFTVIHNGFEFPETQPHLRFAQRQELGIPATAPVVGSIIEFREEKRPKVFIEMAQLLLASNSNLDFVIFGDGELLANCRSCVESQNLSEKILLPGLTEDSWAALSAMDVFVLTSRIEGLPNVLIEAQGMGLPVVCSGAGGMAETFIEGETGYSVPSGTPVELAAAVFRLIQDPVLRQHMGALAAQHARSIFGIDHMIERTVRTYNEAPVLEPK
jgi:glycosyltransferase involved in cell wall biosynthesis